MEHSRVSGQGHCGGWVLAAAAVVGVLLSGGLRGDETAVRTGGQRVAGRLMPDASGAVRFVAGRGHVPVPAAQIQKVIFDPVEGTAPGVSPTHRLEFWDHQSLSGRLLKVDARQVLIADPTGRVLAAPRPRVAAIRQRPGEIGLVNEDFEGPLSGWKTSGPVDLSTEQHLSGRQALRISRTGPMLEYAAATPVEAGRVEVSFWDEGRVPAEDRAQWFVELEFRTPAGPRPVRVVLGWDSETYAVEAARGPSLAVQPLRRQPGWHRLIVTFGASRFLVVVDNAVLASGDGPATPLAAVRLGAAAPSPDPPAPVAGRPPGARAAGAVGYFDDFRLARRVEPIEALRNDPDQDELVFADGDELFGEVRQGDVRRVAIAGSYGVIGVPWSAIHGLLLRRRPIEPGRLDGLILRVQFRPPGETDPPPNNVLEGALRAVTDGAVRIQTTAFGLITISRAAIRELDLLFRGRRIEIDPRFHHLGTTVSPDLDIPAPDGPQFSARFDLDAVPTTPTVVAVSVVQMDGTGPGARFADRLRRGELRTSVAINGREFDYFNKYIRFLPVEPLRLRVPVPRGILKPGRNTITIRQAPQKDDPQQFDDCGVFGLALEIAAEPAAGPK